MEVYAQYAGNIRQKSSETEKKILKRKLRIILSASFYAMNLPTSQMLSWK
jgi:hypothetical protein